MITLTAHDALAQDQAPQQAPASAQGAAAPRPAWTTFISGGLALQEGTTDQRGFNLRGGAVRVVQGSPWAHEIDADLGYLKVAVSGFEQTAVNSSNVRYLARRQLTPRVFFALRPAFKRNKVQQIDYRFEELVGVGFVLAQQERFNLTAIPVVGAVQQQKNIPSIDGGTATAGVVQTASFTLRSRNPEDASTIQQQFIYLADLSNADDRRVQANITLSNPIAGPFSVDVIYTIDHENLVLGTVEGTDQRLDVNFRVQLRF